MSKEYKGIDNITMIKKLTHKNGSVNCIIFDELFKDFDSYIVFRKELYEHKNMKLHPAIADKSKIKFRVEFINKKMVNRFIDKNDDRCIEYRNHLYTPDINIIDEHIIEISLIKK